MAARLVLSPPLQAVRTELAGEVAATRQQYLQEAGRAQELEAQATALRAQLVQHQHTHGQ